MIQPQRQDGPGLQLSQHLFKGPFLGQFGRPHRHRTLYGVVQTTGFSRPKQVRQIPGIRQLEQGGRFAGRHL